MTKDDFKLLFDKALATAIASAEQQLQRPIPHDVEILLHGARHSGELLSPSEALGELYLGEDEFYLVIDVAVIAVSNHLTRVIMIASGHAPGPFEQTWNDPPGSGPFKQVISKEIGLIES
jgi:hypothetical protein